MRERDVRRRTLAAAALVLAARLAQPDDQGTAGPLPLPGPADLRRLEAGEVVVTTTDVPGHTLPRVTATAIIEAPPQRIWPIIDACGRYRETMPSVLESEELERTGDRVRCRIVYDRPFPLPDAEVETDAIHTAGRGGWYRRAWTLRRGDFRENTGSFTLEPYGAAATFVQYQVLSEPKSAVPKFLVRRALEVMLPRMFQAIRERAK